MARNPLLNSRLNTSKEPPKRPEAIPPVPEEYEGDNNPYRGTQSHGVERTVEPSPIEGYGATQTGVTYVKPPKDEEPVPVRIVQEHGREFRRWRVQLGTATARGGQIIGRNDARSAITIYNRSGGESIFISHDLIDGANARMVGYELGPTDTVTLHSEAEVFAAVEGDPFSDTSTANWQAVEIYSVEL